MSSRWSSGIPHHPKRKSFQCKNIPDEMMIAAVLLAGEPTRPQGWRMRWDVETELRKLLGDDAPIGLAKVMMAKFYKLERKGILHGCYCGCRGDYHLPNEYETCC